MARGNDPEPHRPWSLLFGRTAVNRRTYALVGFGLMGVKYLVEVLVVWFVIGAFFDPWTFLVPSLEGRRQLLGEHAGLMGFAWWLWTLPFVWIAFSMTLRRALDAGLSPWLSAGIFVPVFNLVLMICLACLPTRRDEGAVVAAPGPEPVVDRRKREADDELGVRPPGVLQILRPVVLSMAGMAGVLGLAIYGLGEYALGVFVGAPAVLGLTIAVLTHRPGEKASGTFGKSTMALCFVFGLLLLLGFEGAICIAMSVPIAVPLNWVGTWMGIMIVERSRYPQRHVGFAMLGLPLCIGLESALRDPPMDCVTTSVTIDAPIETVWANVIRFPGLPEPEEWVFKLGIACPMSARIDGSGVGAVRHCIFSTGTFVEPITAWEEPTRLAFDVREQPAPMFELSPYSSLHPPHLDGALRCDRGEFRLERLADGRTRLIGTTWYRLDIHPRQYWGWWSDWLIQVIHRRVLEHIRRASE